MLEKIRKHFLLLLVVPYVVGLIGFSIKETSELFLTLTPVMLLFSLFLVLVEEERVVRKNSLVIILIGVFGFGAEALGVNTGVLFGDYEYGTVLGPKLFGVPFLIATNWVMLCIAAYSISTRVTTNSYLQAALSASMVTAFDMILEPVAIKYRWWWWQDVSVPIYNYVTWFVLAFLFVLMLSSGNKSAMGRSFYLIIIQTLFFIWLLIW